MTTPLPPDFPSDLGVAQQRLLALMADGLFRSALDVEDEGLGFSEGQARATLRSLEVRGLVEAGGSVGGSVRRSFRLTDAGRAAAASFNRG